MVYFCVLQCSLVYSKLHTHKKNAGQAATDAKVEAQEGRSAAPNAETPKHLTCAPLANGFKLRDVYKMFISGFDRLLCTHQIIEGALP